jgi:predicted outer membrane repeat protein
VVLFLAAQSETVRYGQRIRSQTGSRQRSACRPRLEALEDRSLPSTLTVTNNLDSGSGSLRAEINKAHSGDTIVFAPSLDGQTITLTSGELLLKKNLTITGPGAGQLTISGGGVSRVFEVGSKFQLALSGLTLSGGKLGVGSSLNGGAISNDVGATLTVSGCTLSNNSTAYNGGAIYNAGTATVTNSILSGDFAGNGGGICNDAGATLKVSGCTLSGNSTNSAYVGGGAIDNRGSATISNCTLSNNAAKGPDYGFGYGGAIGNEAGGTMTVSGCTLSNNTAGGRGGAIYNAGTMTVTGCTLSGNSDSSGGTIYAYYGTLYVGTSHFSGGPAPYSYDYIFGNYIDWSGNTFS